MSDADQLPRVRAFIAELGGLAAEDKALPLEILVRVCRARLQAPILILPQLHAVRYTRHALEDLERILDIRYPALRKGAAIYHQDAKPHVITQGALANAEYYLRRRLFTSNTMIVRLEAPLIQAGLSSTWHSYSVPWIMYELTLTTMPTDTFAVALEEALALDPSVARAMLQLADLTQAEAQLMDSAQAAKLARAEWAAVRKARRSLPFPWHRDRNTGPTPSRPQQLF